MKLRSVSKSPAIVIPRTQVRPWRSEKAPHQPVVMQARTPAQVVITGWGMRLCPGDETELYLQ